MGTYFQNDDEFDLFGQMSEPAQHELSGSPRRLSSAESSPSEIAGDSPNIEYSGYISEYQGQTGQVCGTKAEWGQEMKNSTPAMVSVEPIEYQTGVSTLVAENFSTSTEDNTKAQGNGQKKKKGKSKGDEIRNLYPNVMKVALSAILEGPFGKKLERISREVSRYEAYVSVEEFKDFCRGMRKKEFSLREIYEKINYQGGSESERGLKRMLQKFLIWFLENRYSAYVLRSEQCEHKEAYLRGKNILKYLPTLKSKPSRMH